MNPGVVGTLKTTQVQGTGGCWLGFFWDLTPLRSSWNVRLGKAEGCFNQACPSSRGRSTVGRKGLPGSFPACSSRFLESPGVSRKVERDQNKEGLLFLLESRALSILRRQ